jgi:hypothetical protein
MHVMFRFHMAASDVKLPTTQQLHSVGDFSGSLNFYIEIFFYTQTHTQKKKKRSPQQAKSLLGKLDGSAQRTAPSGSDNM